MELLTRLPDRGVIEITGDDRVGFLQGLVSNDVALAAPGTAVFAALLTPQGRWLADFFVLAEGDRLLLDIDSAVLPTVLQKLTRFRLRAKAALRDASADLLVHVAWNGRPDLPEPDLPEPDLPKPDLPKPDLPEPELPRSAIVAADPRLPMAGWRVLAASELPTNAGVADWDHHRLSLGLPDSADMEAEKSLLLEAGFDELSGVSWTKGCYMGQELTARTKYRGLVKKRLVKVDIQGALPPPGTPVLLDGREVGVMRSGRDGIGIAQLRLDAMAGDLRCGEAVLKPRPPDWMRLPEAVV